MEKLMKPITRHVYLGVWKHFYIKAGHLIGLQPDDFICFDISGSRFSIPVYFITRMLEGNKAWNKHGRYADSRDNGIPNWLMKFKAN